jgi:hypothetical protein
MSGEELLARLSRLDERDRAWLLGELPAAMRRELATLLSDEPERAAPALPAAPSGWEALDTQRLAAVFETEPAWLVSAATRGTEPRWRDRLLHAMDSRRRHEIELADRSGGAFGARAASCLLEGCRERLAAGVEPARDHTPRHGFAALLDQMKERFS